MKPEKMTDDDVAQALEDVSVPWEKQAQRIRAHIAALEAERERWEQTTMSLQNLLKRSGAEVRELTMDRDRLLEQRGAIATNLGEARTERDALRERVQALELDIEMERAECERASDSDDDHLRRLQEAESRLAAIRQRAANTSTMAEAAKVRLARGEALSDVVDALARFIVGDAPEVCAETSSPCRSGGTTYASEAMGEDCDNCGEPLCKHGTIEPTTVEAFATARDMLLMHYDPDETCMHHLSLLERRMGAMAQRLNASCPLCHGKGEYLPSCSMCQDSTWDHECPGPVKCEHETHAALTDAPPVFTLEEVEKAFNEWKANPTISFSQALVTLRR
jgi:hypothetical protein